jgi:hypothetical protein
VAIFFPSIGPAAPLQMRQEKTWLQLQNSGMMIKEKQQEFEVKKRKEIRWRVQLQSLIFLIRCGKNPIIYDDPAPSPAFNILLQFNPSF